jgi:hypothetical protein
MYYPKEEKENNELFENINFQILKEKINEEEENNLSPIFKKEFEKIFCNENSNFQNENDNDFTLIKTTEANLIFLEKEIDNININRTDLKHVNIINQLNEIYESKNSSINEKIKALKLQEKLMDKLIFWINEKINDFS